MTKPFEHISGAVDSALRARLNDTIDRAIAQYDPSAHNATFSSGGAHLESQDYFWASARDVRCFLEPESLEDGVLNRPKSRAINKIGHAFHDHCDAFAELARSPAIKQALHRIKPGAWQLMQSMVIMKPPQIGGEVNWHQDSTFLMDSEGLLQGFWLALDDADTDNGCLWFAHDTQGLRARMLTDWESGTTHFETLNEAAFNTENAIAAPCQAGDLVRFDGLTPHASAPNRSERPRRALTLHFKPASSDWHPANWLQRGNLAPFEVYA